MSYKLVKKLTTVNYTKGNSGRKYIVIHYTGNRDDSASANANYFKSVNRGASAHYFVDRTSVYQVVSDDDTAWAVGKNYGSNNLFGKCTNKNSISIEMCSNGGKIHDDTYKNTVELTKKLMKKYNIPASNVVTHYMVCSKICPGWKGWTGSDISIWNKFKKDISTATTSSTTSTSASEPKPATNKEFKVKVTVDALNIRKEPSADSKKVGCITNKGTYTITKTSGSWGYLKSGAGWINISNKYVQRL